MREAYVNLVGGTWRDVKHPAGPLIDREIAFSRTRRDRPE